MPAIENKPAPGQTGPKGLSPRTTYSKVNTGSPPVLDGGAAQKNIPNQGMQFLPAKIAEQRGSMTTMHERPSLQAMVKAAMAGTANALQVNLEATRQATSHRGSTKMASAVAETPGQVSSEHVHKLASALGHIGQMILKEAEGDLGPGEGPGALTVMQATSSETNVDAGEQGQATAAHQPPMNPPLQAEKVQEGNAGTGLETNDEMQHPEQPVEPIKNAAARVLERLNKTAAIKALPSGEGHAGRKAMDVVKGGLGKAKDLAGKAVNVAKTHPKSTAGLAGGLAAAGGAAALVGKKKKASPTVALIRKVAEDAINPAQISAGTVDPAAPPSGASAAGEQVPSEPSDVTSQKSMISSNEAAINYTKGQAKADPKKDVNQVLTEPALSSATDKTLAQAFDATGQAGVKISSMRKTAAAVSKQRVLLNELLKRASADVQKGH